VEVRDAEAQPCRGLKAPGRGMHANRRRGERVGGWEEECTPVLPVFVGSFGWSGDDVVPSKRKGST
jgi:hypothetical protein